MTDRSDVGTDPNVATAPSGPVADSTVVQDGCEDWRAHVVVCGSMVSVC
jgi:hypothetical protein